MRLSDFLVSLFNGPHVLENVLFALPTLNVDGGPGGEHDEVRIIPLGVKDAEVVADIASGLATILIRLVLICQVEVIAPKEQPKEGGNEEHGDVMYEESEVHRLLLTVVVCDEQNGLDMFHEGAYTKHGQNQPHPVQAPTFLNLGSLARVQHEVTFDNICLSQYCNIEFLFKYFVEERHFLRGHEALKVILGFQNKGQSLEFVLELHSHANFFSFKVENSVTEVNENDSVLVWFLRMSVLFPFEELVFTMQETKVFTSISLLLFILGIDAIKLVNKNIFTRSIYDKYVVRLLIDADFGEVKRVLADEIFEDFFD